MSTAILQLGRYGDLLNALPLAQRLNASGDRPTIVVAKEFADIGNVISYADILSFAGTAREPGRALAWCKNKFGKIIFPQVDRPDCQSPPRSGRSFCEMAYDNAGFGDDFRAGAFDRIVIDRRNQSREAALVKRVFKTSLPKVLVNTSGFSSPFGFTRELMATLAKRAAPHTFEIVDLAQVRAENFCDLLGLYDRAALLLTTDTSTLHLAGACRVPYIAFVADRPSLWHGSYHRGNCIMRCRYQNTTAALPLISQILVRRFAGALQPEPRLRHIFYRHTTTHPDVRRRNRMAEVSWRTSYALGNWVAAPVGDDLLPRAFNDKIRTLRYVKDLIEGGIKGADPNDYIVLTNSDTAFSPALSKQLSAAARRGKPLIGHRRDFHHLDDPLLSERDIIAGSAYCGTDLFAFPLSWWKKHRDSFPDFLLGSELWDAVLRDMLLRSGAYRTQNLIYHAYHASVWEQPQNRYTLPGQLHNIRLAREGYRRLGMRPDPSLQHSPV